VKRFLVDWLVAKACAGLARNWVGYFDDIKRNCPKWWGCKIPACHAEKAFLKRSQRPKLTLLSQDEELRGVVTKLLGADWSPEQIADGSSAALASTISPVSRGKPCQLIAK
jgi:hypothetical protein